MKRGPKPIGETPMTAAERQRRRREKAKACGGGEYVIRLGSEMNKRLTALAVDGKTSNTAILLDIVSKALRE